MVFRKRVAVWATLIATGLATMATAIVNAEKIYEIYCRHSDPCNRKLAIARSNALAAGNRTAFLSWYAYRRTRQPPLSPVHDEYEQKLHGELDDTLQALEVHLSSKNLIFYGDWEHLYTHPWLDNPGFNRIRSELVAKYTSSVASDFRIGAWLGGCDAIAWKNNLTIVNPPAWHRDIKEISAEMDRFDGRAPSAEPIGDCWMPSEIEQAGNNNRERAVKLWSTTHRDSGSGR